MNQDTDGLEIYHVFPIGFVQRKKGKINLKIAATYIPALKHLEKFSHVHVFLWTHSTNHMVQRKKIQLTPPHNHAPQTGVFAMRACLHPNPVSLRVVAIKKVDLNRGVIEVVNTAFFDVPDQMPILDIKAYFPFEDRVKDAIHPEWLSHLPLWLPEDVPSNIKNNEKSGARTQKKQADPYSIFPVGYFRKKGGPGYVEIEAPFKDGLKNLGLFSHVRIIWWFHRFQKDRYRRVLQCHPPYENAPKTGVFASRSPVRPNPIGLTTAKITHIDGANGIIELKGFDGFDHTPIIDIKPYISAYGRIKAFKVPEWIRHWPEWRPEEDEHHSLHPENLVASDFERLKALQASKIETRASPSSSKPIIKTETAVGEGKNNLIIRGARVHNLKNIDVCIPKNKFTVITGVSGSGKSSLAFDTLHAEGQRRYMEGLSTLARQYLDQIEKPDIDHIAGLTPTIAIEQKRMSNNPRSTVGTITQIHDFLRVLFSRIGIRHCPQCGRAIKPQASRRISDQLAGLLPGTRFRLYENKLGTTTGEFIVPDGGAEEKQAFRKNLFRVVQETLSKHNGTLGVALDNGEDFLLTQREACPHCNLIFFKMTASLFSYNSPEGMCPDCNGLGVKLRVDPDLIVSEPDRSLLDGASLWWGNLRKSKQTGNWMRAEVLGLAEHWNIDLEKPWKQLPKKFQQAVLYGLDDEKVRFSYEMGKSGRSGEIERPIQGAVSHINRLFSQAHGKSSMQTYLKFIREQSCLTCRGERLCSEARFVTVGEKRMPEIVAMTVAQLKKWISDITGQLDTEQRKIAGAILTEISSRVQAMVNVGLHYLTLDRSVPTLSGGEAQRIRLAGQFGHQLTGLLYILDEPSIGLHPRDHFPLLKSLMQLRDEGNTVVVVEHDADTMRAADWLIDLGPGAGTLGGEVVAAGTPHSVMEHPDSLTGRYLRGDMNTFFPKENGAHRPHGWLVIEGARLHNLKKIDVHFPLGVLTCVTGVSGSGKSSLITQTLSPALAQILNGTQETPGCYDRIQGAEQLDKRITITQTPIGRTPRSNPGTYTGAFDEIRKVFAECPESVNRGYKHGHFSFNTKGGRCESCKGDGRKKIEMHFLPNVWVTCRECHGKRFNPETLEISYKGKTIADVLDMDVSEALTFFTEYPKILTILQTLHDVGLDYIKLGQSALTLSGGEAQRIKLAKELSSRQTGRTLYILDEPTTGLHFADVQKLLEVIHRLAEAGNTIIVIEHHPDVIKTADWIIDLGPEGGEEGGYIVAQGKPEDIAGVEKSYTGQYLKTLL